MSSPAFDDRSARAALARNFCVWWAVCGACPVLLMLLTGWRNSGIEGPRFAVLAGIFVVLMSAPPGLHLRYDYREMRRLHGLGRVTQGRVVTIFPVLSSVTCGVMIEVPAVGYGSVRVRCAGLPAQIRRLRQGDAVQVLFRGHEPSSASPIREIPARMPGGLSSDPHRHACLIVGKGVRWQ